MTVRKSTSAPPLPKVQPVFCNDIAVVSYPSIFDLHLIYRCIISVLPIDHNWIVSEIVLSMPGKISMQIIIKYGNTCMNSLN